jgi:hypothetical protein
MTSEKVITRLARGIIIVHKFRVEMLDWPVLLK